MSLRPTSELVAQAWLLSVPGIPAGSVATTLPGRDVDPTSNYSWAASGFITVETVGGSPHREVPLRQPVLSVDCWAVNPGSKRPPWGRANALAEHVVNSVYSYLNSGDYHRHVTLGGNYADAFVNAAIITTEPRRRPSDQANYAHYGFELELHWITI